MTSATPHLDSPLVPSSSRIFLVIRLVLGGGLLVTAGLKAHGLTIDAIPRDSILASPQFQFLAIEMETLFGLWLLSGWAQRAAWFGTLCFFLLLAGVSLHLALAGQVSCGCFGEFQVNPWLTFYLDLAIVGLLAIIRPHKQATPSSPCEASGIALLTASSKITVGAVVLFLLIAFAFTLFVDSPADTLAWLRGESLTITPGISNLGDAAPGESRQISLAVFNHTDRPIKIVGAASSCGCNPLRDLPVTISPGQAERISVQVTFGAMPGSFERRIVLFTDHDNQPRITAYVVGAVVAPSKT